MSRKTRARLNRILSNLRDAQALLDGISLADGLSVFDTCRPAHQQVGEVVATLSLLTKKPAL